MKQRKWDGKTDIETNRRAQERSSFFWLSKNLGSPYIHRSNDCK